MEMPGSAECNIHLQHTGHSNFKKKGAEKDEAAIKKMLAKDKGYNGRVQLDPEEEEEEQKVEPEKDEK